MQKEVTIISFDEVEKIKHFLNHAKEIALEVRNGDMSVDNNDCVIDDLCSVLEMFN